MRLAERCAMCASTIWCGRQCKHAPTEEQIVIYGSMSDTVINTSQPLLTSSSQRQAKWRKANPEVNRQRAREGMRKLRAANAST